MFTEIELKLRLPPDRVSCLLRQPLLKSFTASNPITRRLYSIYYDTPDLDLRRRGFNTKNRANEQLDQQAQQMQNFHSRNSGKQDGVNSK